MVEIRRGCPHNLERNSRYHKDGKIPNYSYFIDVKGAYRPCTAAYSAKRAQAWRRCGERLIMAPDASSKKTAQPVHHPPCRPASPCASDHEILSHGLDSPRCALLLRQCLILLPRWHSTEVFLRRTAQGHASRRSVQPTVNHPPQSTTDPSQAATRPKPTTPSPARLRRRPTSPSASPSTKPSTMTTVL